jgi:hypothetical protein
MYLSPEAMTAKCLRARKGTAFCSFDAGRVPALLMGIVQDL